MAQLTFYLKNQNAINKSAIYASVSFDAKRLQISTNWSIHPKYWGKKRGSIKHQYTHLPFYSTYQDYLERFRRVIIEYYQEQKSIGIIPDLSSIKKHLKEEFKEKEEVQVQDEFFMVFKMVLLFST